MFTAIVLATRYRTLPVWLGLASAFLIHVIIALTAGQLLSLLPERVVTGSVALLFLVFAGLLLLKTDDEPAEEEIATPVTRRFGRIYLTAFLAVFITEWGDLTQLATIGLNVRFNDSISVGVGALAALWLVTGLGVLLGQRLVTVLPLRAVRRVAGVVLLALGIWAAIDFVRL